jgi:hypothetical protein
MDLRQQAAVRPFAVPLRLRLLIRGSNFGDYGADGAPVVFVGSYACRVILHMSTSEALTCVTSAGDSGVYNVAISVGGADPVVATRAFTYRDDVTPSRSWRDVSSLYVHRVRPRRTSTNETAAAYVHTSDFPTCSRHYSHVHPAPPFRLAAALLGVSPSAGPPGSVVNVIGGATWYLRNQDCVPAAWGEGPGCVGSVTFGDWICADNVSDATTGISFGVTGLNNRCACDGVALSGRSTRCSLSR